MKAFLVDLENKPGELAAVAEALATKGINITGVSGSACGDSGRVALTTADEAATRMALQDAGRRFDEFEAVEASMRHEPGTLAKTARRLADAGINIEAILPTGTSGNEVSVAFVTKDAARAREVLAAATTGNR